MHTNITGLLFIRQYQTMYRIKLILIASFLWLSSGVKAQVIVTADPVFLPVPPATTQTVENGQSLSVTSNTSVMIGPGFTAATGSVVQINVIATAIYPVPPASNNDNIELNWVIKRTLDQNGSPVSESKNFFDLSGLALQSQSKSFTTQHVLASQPLYDLYGRTAIQTLVAPINSSTYIYKPDFVRNTSGQRYNTTNFDIGNKLNAPDPVDDSQQGTLGWYYSNNNSWDKFIPATPYPYSRTDYFNDGTNTPARTAGIGEELRMGKGRESVSNNFPVLQELTNYLAIRNKFFPEASMGQLGQTDLTGTSVQNIGKDQQGNWGMSIQEKDGKTLMSALPGNWLTVNNTVQLANYREQLVLDGNTGDYIKDVKVTGAGKLKVYDNDILVYNSNLVDFPLPAMINSSHKYRFMSNEPLTASYSAVYGNGVVSPVCENCRSLVQSGNVNGQDYHYLSLPQGGTLSITGGAVQVLNLINNTVLYNNQTTAIILPVGMYKVIAVSGTPQIKYTTQWSDISYNYYDQKGQLVATIPPNGVQQLITNGLGAYADKNTIPFVTLFEYDRQGRLLAVDNKSENGRSEFIYRKDGKIRFSQNAEQRKNGRFSYTNYDDTGKVLESGEYLPGDIAFITAKTNLVLLENTTENGGLTGGTKTNWVRTHYDLPDNSHGQSGYIQNYVEGSVSWTENVNSKTWYSYDQEGKIIWVIKWLNGGGYKTIDYTYDYFNNVTSVAYQKNVAGEMFYHYYAYDADQRLVNVQTSRDGVTKLQQANYQYYLHGPLKRIELADRLQGIDYTYTAQGWLKTINSPTKNVANDPGKDGGSSFAADAFGMQLEYFPNDYNRTGSNITSVPTGQQTYYNGNVNGISWQSSKPYTVSGLQDPTMYTYSYDNKYQLTTATWGTPNFTSPGFTPSTMFKESGISYDANGNINSLQRTDKNGVVSDDFSKYTYQAGTNKLTTVGNIAGSNYASYTYDELGQLKSQIQAGVSSYLKYDVAGKIIGVYNDAALTMPKVTYTYDESGNRIKTVNENGTVWYVYDASGSVMAIYAGTTPTISEIPVYGADRLGTYFVSGNCYYYELRDNVGSIKAVLNRNKVNGEADIINYTDYYPYGSVARSAGIQYRYEYQGAYAEKDGATGYNNFNLRMYNGRIGRWFSVDPARQFTSPYEGIGNNPVTGNDPTGGFWQELANWMTTGHWISNAGKWFMEKHENASFNGWTGNKLTGYASVGYINEKGEPTVSYFNANQDFLPHLAFYNLWGNSIVASDFGDRHSSFTPGPFVFSSDADYKHIDIANKYTQDHYRHEFGHKRQWELLGTSDYFKLVVIPSVKSYRNNQTEHDYFKTETSASGLGAEIYGKYHYPKLVPVVERLNSKVSQTMWLTDPHNYILH
jgi:RHS repeat-associated protein